MRFTGGEGGEEKQYGQVLMGFRAHGRAGAPPPDPTL